MEHQIDPITNEKMKKNLVYVGIFSIIMLFAGFTSAYIVLMGDSFWLKHPMPTSFYISTVVVIMSSITFYLALKAAKKDNHVSLKAFMLTTVLLGISFVFFQFRGYSELIDKGFYAANNKLLVVDGRYGDYYKISVNDNMIFLNGNSYFLNEEEMTGSSFDDLKTFVTPFLNLTQGKKNEIPKWNEKYKLYYQDYPLSCQNGYLVKSNLDTLEYVDLLRLKQLAQNIMDERGDFFAKGKFGEDFQIYYKGQELGYEVDGHNRYLTFEGKPLSPSLQNKAIQAADSASSFLYVITFVHLLHIIVALIYLLKLSISSFSGKFNSSNNLSLKTGSIFWHFLGLLWLYLLLFLIYIH